MERPNIGHLPTDHNFDLKEFLRFKKRRPAISAEFAEKSDLIDIFQAINRNGDEIHLKHKKRKNLTKQSSSNVSTKELYSRWLAELGVDSRVRGFLNQSRDCLEDKRWPEVEVVTHLKSVDVVESVVESSNDSLFLGKDTEEYCRKIPNSVSNSCFVSTFSSRLNNRSSNIEWCQEEPEKVTTSMSSLPVDDPLREVLSPVTQLINDRLFLLDNPVIELHPSPQHMHTSDPLADCAKNVNLNAFVGQMSSGDRSSELEMKKNILLNALGRHTEGELDAVLQMVMDFYLPIAAADADVSEDVDPFNKGTSQPVVSQSSAGFISKEDGLRRRVAKQISEKLNSNSSVKVNNDMRSNPEIFNWEHILFAVQSHADELKKKDKPNLRVHSELPDIGLTPLVVQRIQSRLLGLFGGAVSNTLHREVRKPCSESYSGYHLPSKEKHAGKSASVNSQKKAQRVSITQVEFASKSNTAEHVDEGDESYTDESEVSSSDDD